MLKMFERARLRIIAARAVDFAVLIGVAVGLVFVTPTIEGVLSAAVNSGLGDVIGVVLRGVALASAVLAILVPLRTRAQMREISIQERVPNAIVFSSGGVPDFRATLHRHREFLASGRSGVPLDFTVVVTEESVSGWIGGASVPRIAWSIQRPQIAEIRAMPIQFQGSRTRGFRLEVLAKQDRLDLELPCLGRGFAASFAPPLPEIECLARRARQLLQLDQRP